MIASEKRLQPGVALGTWLVLLFVLAPSKGQNSAANSPPVEAPKNQAVAAPVTGDAKGVEEYTIGPEDLLDIDVYDFPELTKTVRVARDGSIVLTFLGQVPVAGMTTQQLQRDITVRYSKDYLESPQVTVSVKEFHARPVSVGGAVVKPGLYQLVGPRTLTEMLVEAGGPHSTAGRTVIVKRQGGFGTLDVAEGMRVLAPDEVEINLHRLYYEHEEGLNIPIRPLDTITVRKAGIIYVVGAVRNSAGFALTDRDEVTVLQALAMAGGFDRTASKRGTRIIRRGAGDSRKEIPVDLGKILKGESEDVELAANDILFVPWNAGKSAGLRGVDYAIGLISGLAIYGKL
jgi:polysaccharide export outer membrane protein